MPSAKRERQREGRQARQLAAMAEQKRRQRWRTVRNMAIVFVLIVGVIVFLSLRSGDKKDTSTVASNSTASNGTTTTAPPPPFQYGTGACPTSTALLIRR